MWRTEQRNRELHPLLGVALEVLWVPSFVLIGSFPETGLEVCLEVCFKDHTLLISTNLGQNSSRCFDVFGVAAEPQRCRRSSFYFLHQAEAFQAFVSEGPGWFINKYD